MFNFNEISVVVQGPVVKDRINGERASATTCEVIDSIRKHLPGSEIIFSTWQGQDVSDLCCDKILLNEDPGACGDRLVVNSANIKRQILSTKSGLSHATKRYALKLRSDTSITSNEFASFWYKCACTGMRPTIFNERILVSAIFTPNPFYCPSPYWVSDFFAFGLLDDVVKLWNINYASIDRFANMDVLINSTKSKIVNCSAAINAEQRLILSLLENHGIKEELKTITTINPIILMRSEKFIASHFIPIDPHEHGLKLPVRFDRFRKHHTFRNDLSKKLFRSRHAIGAKFALICRIIPIVIACLKGCFGRVRRFVIKFKICFQHSTCP